MEDLKEKLELSKDNLILIESIKDEINEVEVPDHLEYDFCGGSRITVDIATRVTEYANFKKDLEWAFIQTLEEFIENNMIDKDDISYYLSQILEFGTFIQY